MIRKWCLLFKKGMTNPSKIISFLIFSIDYLVMKIHRFFMYLSRNSIVTLEIELPSCSLLASRMIDKIVEIYKPQSVLDLGCGTGKAIDYFLGKYIPTIFGVEGSQMAINSASHPELIKNFNLNNELNLNKHFDIIFCFEFIEHIHPRCVHNLMKTFSNHSNVIVLTAALPGQGGLGHFNEQPPEYWIKIFSKYGYRFNEKNALELKRCKDMFSDNILVFERVSKHHAVSRFENKRIKLRI